MRGQNVCKFYTSSLSEAISIHCFVYETDSSVMQRVNTLQNSRMILITQGNGTVILNGKALCADIGSLIFAFPNETLSFSEGASVAYMYVDFSGMRAETLLQRFGINHENRYFVGFGGMIPFWKENLLRASPETVDLAAESVLLHTLSRMKREKPTQNETISSILQIIENRFSDHSLSIISVGEELSYHPKYLSHLFKKEMGVGFSEYLRDKRINYARTLFDHGIDSIKNVALLSGFNDPLYFSSVFKKVTGDSPSQYIAKQSTDKK